MSSHSTPKNPQKVTIKKLLKQVEKWTKEVSRLEKAIAASDEKIAKLEEKRLRIEALQEELAESLQKARERWRNSTESKYREEP